MNKQGKKSFYPLFYFPMQTLETNIPLSSCMRMSFKIKHMLMIWILNVSQKLMFYKPRWWWYLRILKILQVVRNNWNNWVSGDVFECYHIVGPFLSLFLAAMIWDVIFFDRLPTMVFFLNMHTSAHTSQW